MKNIVSVDRFRTPPGGRLRNLLRDWSNDRLLVDVMPTLSLAEWDAVTELLNELGVVVRETNDRSVFRIVCEDGTLYAKHYHPRRNSGMLRLAMVRPAKREFIAAEEAVARGIPTATPLLQRDAPRVVESLYVSEGVPGAIPLVRIRDGNAGPEQPKRLREAVSLLDAAADFLADVHAKGLCHHDFHAGNVLVSRAGTGEYSLFLIDMVAAGFSRGFSWKQAKKDLVVWNAEWRDRVSTRLRERFLIAYFLSVLSRDSHFLTRLPRRLRKMSSIQSLESLVSPVFEEIDRESRAYSRKVDARRDRRVWRTNRDFIALNTILGKSYFATDFIDPFEVFTMQLTTGFARKDQKVVKTSSSHIVSRLKIRTRGGDYVVADKQSRKPTSLRKILRNPFRKSKAAKEWFYANAMHSRGIPTARPIGLIEAAAGPFFIQSHVLTQWLDKTVDLHAWARAVESLKPANRRRRVTDAAQTLGRAAGNMHAKGVSHGDLKASNILVKNHKGRIEPYFIDVSGAHVAKRGGELSLRRRVRDLARLAESATAYPWIGRSAFLTFFRAYAEALLPGRCDWKRLWRLASKRASRRIERKQARGEPVL